MKIILGYKLIKWHIGLISISCQRKYIWKYFYLSEWCYRSCMHYKIRPKLWKNRQIKHHITNFSLLFNASCKNVNWLFAHIQFFFIFILPSSRAVLIFWKRDLWYQGSDGSEWFSFEWLNVVIPLPHNGIKIRYNPVEMIILLRSIFSTEGY